MLGRLPGLLLHLFKYAEHVIASEDLLSNVIQHGQDQLVEELPFVCEEEVEEGVVFVVVVVMAGLSDVVEVWAVEMSDGKNSLA